MKSNSVRALTVTLLTMSVLGLTACGASKSGGSDSGSTDLGSRNPIVPGGSTGSGVVAECNSIPANNTNIEGRLTSYYHPTTGEYVATTIRLAFDRLPVEITTGSTHYVQMFKWKADSTGQKVFSTTPVGFYAMNRTTKQYVGKTATTVISKASIQKLISDNNLGSGITLNNFFDKHILILDSISLDYDALSFAVYNSAQGTKAIATTDALIPAFAANPNEYASSHPAVLQAIHPFYNDRGAGLSDNHFRTISMESCIP